MGIGDFMSKEDYALLCMLLMFLEEKDAQDPFVLSQLLEFISLNISGDFIDWVQSKNRRRLIRVLRFAVQESLIVALEGREEDFAERVEGEILYANTGASRYFMRRFSETLTDCRSLEDILRIDSEQGGEEQGAARRHRVYKRLLYSPGVYRADGLDADFEYIKNYASRMNEELGPLLKGQINVYRGSAYFIASDGCRMGEFLPTSTMTSDLVVLVCRLIQAKIASGDWKPGTDERIIVDEIALEQLIVSAKKDYSACLAKTYREKTDREFIADIYSALIYWTIIKPADEAGAICIYPAAGLLSGHYPKEWEKEASHE